MVSSSIARYPLSPVIVQPSLQHPRDAVLPLRGVAEGALSILVLVPGIGKSIRKNRYVNYIYLRNKYYRLRKIMRCCHLGAFTSTSADLGLRLLHRSCWPFTRPTRHSLKLISFASCDRLFLVFALPACAFACTAPARMHLTAQTYQGHQIRRGGGGGGAGGAGSGGFTHK